MVELSHDSRPIIGRGPPLGATFLTLALASVALMVADKRYNQLEQVREWLSAAAYPVQAAVDLPFRAWDWVTGSFADRSRLREENLELTARLRLANLQLQRFAALEDENRRLRDMRENSAGVADRVLVASIMNVDLDPFRHRVLVDKGARDGAFKGQAWRIGLMGHSSRPANVLLFLAALEQLLAEQGYRFEPGAAVAAAAVIPFHAQFQSMRRPLFGRSGKDAGPSGDGVH